MANAIYPTYKAAILGGAANSALTGSGATGLYAALIDTGTYTYSASHEFYSSISGVVGTDREVTSPTLTGGLLSGGNVTYTTVTGVSVEAIVLYRKNAGANTTWRLVAYLDTGITGLPVTPTGGSIVITWNASGIIQF